MSLGYYCDNYPCNFLHEGWCAYWDTSVELMKMRGEGCPMTPSIHEQIETLMEIRWDDETQES